MSIIQIVFYLKMYIFGMPQIVHFSNAVNTTPLFGVIQGFQPIVGYNYGANKPDRVVKVLRTGIIYITVLCSVIFTFIFAFTEGVLRFFTNDAELIKITLNPLRISMLMYPLLGIQFIAFSFFQAIGKSLQGLFISISRQLLFIVPLIFILPAVFGINYIWYSYPISDFLSIVVSVLYITLGIKKYKSNFVVDD